MTTLSTQGASVLTQSSDIILPGNASLPNVTPILPSGTANSTTGPANSTTGTANSTTGPVNSTTSTATLTTDTATLPPGFTLREATLDDAAALQKIYAYYVLHTAVSFEYTPPSVSEFRARMAAILGHYPYLVIEAPQDASEEHCPAQSCAEKSDAPQSCAEECSAMASVPPTSGRDSARSESIRSESTGSEDTQSKEARCEKASYGEKRTRPRQIVGYAYAHTLINRAAYDWSCELTIYLDPNFKGRGLGKAIYEEIEIRLKKQGLLNLYSCIGIPTIPEGDEYLSFASQHFHERMGFTLVGTFAYSGYKFNRFYHMIWMQKLLGSHQDGAAPCLNPPVR